MKNYSYLQGPKLGTFIESITKIWESYGKSMYTAQTKLSGTSKHKLVNLDPVHIRKTDLVMWLETNLGEIDNCKFFICAPGSWGEVHIDGGIPPRNCAINIPIFNCESGYMNWFSNVPEDHKFISNENTNVHSTDENRNIDFWKVEEQMILIKPALVRTNGWHNVDNRDNPKHRVVFSFRFKDNPDFEETRKKLTSFLLN
jgi:hypothetical protein